jgi:hypothetical protein
MVDEYLTRLGRALSGIPADRRDQILADVTEHISEGRATLDIESESSIQALLDRIGDPAEIAAEAGSVPTLKARRRSDVFVPLLLLFGGIVGFIYPLLALVWLAGVAMLWASTSWSITQKLLGTLVLPGGLLPWALLVLQPVAVTSCSDNTLANGRTVDHCSTSGHTLAPYFGIPIFLVTLIAPVLTAWYLSRVLRRGDRVPRLLT